MYTVWKKALAALRIQDVELPIGSEILCVHEQFAEICIWFRCNPSAPKENRRIAIVGTGRPAPDDGGRYIGTASLQGGALIYHVFEQAST